MHANEQTRAQLLQEVAHLRQRVAELEATVAERQPTGAALPGSAIQYRATLDSMGDPIHVVDAELRLVWINPALTQWHLDLGLATDVIGRTVFEAYPFLPERVRAEYQQVFAAGQTLLTQETLAIGSEEFSTEVRKIPVFEQGRVAWVITVIRNLTDRHRAEETLRRRAQELAALNILGQRVNASLSLNQVAQAALNGIAAPVAPDLALLYLREGDELRLQHSIPARAQLSHEDPVHRVGECLCGLAVQEGRAVYSHDIIRDPRCVREECKKAGLRSFAALPLRSGGAIIGVLGLASATERDFGKSAAFLETLADQVAIGVQNARLYEAVRQAAQETSRLLQAEREQRRVAETLRETAHVLSASLNREEVLQLILAQLARVVTYDSASVILVTDGASFVAHRGIRSAEQLAEPEMIALRPHVRAVLEQRRPMIIADTTTDPGWQPQPGAAYIRCWLGVPLIVQGRVIGLLNLDSVQPGFYTARDAELALTFANQAALAIENARLYADVHSRMEELKRAQAQLIQSAKMAAVGQLAAGVAHELNNPLTGVLGFAELLLRHTPPTDPAYEDLTIIVTEARRARDIVRGLLNFARQTEFQREPAQICQVLQETLALVRRQLEKKNITIVEQYAPDLPLLALDVGRMKQVFLNLITNALHAMPQGGVLTVTCEQIGREVVARVADTGVGISAEHLAHLFEPFFTTKPGGQGTGLGLSISLGIVQDHGGRIEVTSQVGAGSTFSIFLPLCCEMAP